MEQQLGEELLRRSEHDYDIGEPTLMSLYRVGQVLAEIANTSAQETLQIQRELNQNSGRKEDGEEAEKRHG